MLTTAAALFALTLGAASTPPDKPDDDADLPPLYLTRYLPPYEVCAAWCATNGRLADLARCQSAAGNPWAERTLAVLCDRGWYWTAAAQATDPRADWTARRRSLKSLAEYLPWDRLLSGRLPDAVPADWLAETREVPAPLAD